MSEVETKSCPYCANDAEEFCDECGGCPDCCDEDTHCEYCELPRLICGCPDCRCEMGRKVRKG